MVMERARWRRWMETKGPRYIAVAEQATMFDVPVKQMPRREVVALLGYLLVKVKAGEHRQAAQRPRVPAWLAAVLHLRARTNTLSQN